MSFNGEFGTIADRIANDLAPVLELELVAGAAWDRGDGVYTTTMLLSDRTVYARGNAYDVRVIDWQGGVRSTMPIRASGLSSLTTGVTVADPDNKVRTALTLYDQRNSTAQILRVVPGSMDDYDVRFTGLLDSWEFSPGQVKLNFKTDERYLRSYQPSMKYLQSEWFHMVNDQVGSVAPLCYGKHDSTGLSLKHGMLPTTTVWKDASSAWYAISVAKLGLIKDVYVASGSNSAVKQAYTTAGAAGNAYEKNYTNGPGGAKVWSQIYFNNGFFPGDDDVVTVDAYGYQGASAFDGTETYTNPVTQIRHLIATFFVGRSTGASGTSTLDAAIIDGTTWADAATYADNHGLEGSRFLKDQKTALDWLREWCESFPIFRPVWSTDGTIKMRMLTNDWPGYHDGTSAVIRREDDIDNSFRYSTDPSDVTGKISASYLIDSVDSKALRTLDVQDPMTGEVSDTSLSMPWQPSRQV